MRLLRFGLALAAALLLATAAPAARAQRPARLPYPQRDDTNRVYDAVEQPAVPVGGPAAFAAYLEKSQRYPPAALQARQEGTVQVSFVVEKTGRVGEATVVQPVAPALDAEALRLVRASPRWTPARDQGRPVRQRVVLPVTFALSESSTVEVPAAAPATPAPPLPPGAVAAPAGTRSGVQVAGAAPGGASVVRPERGAQPVGGHEAFFSWVQANLRYPAEARRRGISAKVPVEFTVQPDGAITDVRVVQKRGAGLDQEAVRLLQSAPKWEPALLQGKPIKQKVTLPVIFQL